MFVIGNYVDSGFGAAKLTALKNFFINFIQLTYFDGRRYINMEVTIGCKISELNAKFGGAPLYVEYDDPCKTGNPGYIRITRGKSRQVIARLSLCWVTENTMI